MEEKENVAVEAKANEEVKEVVKDDEESKKTKVGMIIIVSALVIAIGLFVGGCALGEHRSQDSAVRYGAGEYYADSTGKTHFRYISAKGAELNAEVASDTNKVILSTPVENK